MSEIQPFRAFRYNITRVSLNQVVTQPYDKITPSMQERYYAASPYNLIAVEKGRVLPDDTPDENVYTRSAAKLEEWIEQRILVRDAAPAVYVYAQEYDVPGTELRRTRTGFIALGRLEDYSHKVVFPHERTLSAPKADRLDLLRETRAETGQLFMLYDDPARRVDSLLEAAARGEAPVEVIDEYSVAHRLWPIFDEALISQIQREMADKRLVIADGHHRYETALNYRDELRGPSAHPDPLASYEFAMMTFVNARSRGLTILPTHRLVRNVSAFNFAALRKAVAPRFDWYSYPFQNADQRAASYAEFRKDFENPKHGRRGIGVYAGEGAFYLFLLKRHADLEEWLPEVPTAQRELDVVLLHKLIIEQGLGIAAEAVAEGSNIAYEREMDAAILAVDRGEAQLACLLKPVHIGQVMEMALGGQVLPQKSTDFYPKLLSGMAIYRLEGGREARSVKTGPNQPGSRAAAERTR
ncbi:MAG TPA: DUF1015 domain-containing protein [Candidatus Cybelea sp.]|nr:DUF1015 domain-containing protein [Candidatus Cybelea sp.]